MLDGKPCGFGMQLSTLGVLKKNFMSCILYFKHAVTVSCLGKNCCSFFLVLVGRYGKTKYTIIIATERVHFSVWLGIHLGLLFSVFISCDVRSIGVKRVLIAVPIFCMHPSSVRTVHKIDSTL